MQQERNLGPLNVQDLIDLIGRMYDAPLTDDGWENLLPAFAEHFNSPLAHILSQDSFNDSANLLGIHGWDPALEPAYEGHYADIDLQLTDLCRRPPGVVYTDQMYPDQAQYLQSEIHNDWFAPHDGVHALATFAFRDQGRVTVLAVRRSTNTGPYTQNEIAQLQVIVPHFQRVIQIQRHVAGIAAERDMLAGTLELLSTAALIVDRDGTVERMNGTAERILGLRDGLSLDAGRLSAALSDEADRLRRLIAQCASRDVAIQTAGGGLLVSRPSGLRAFEVLISPLPARYRASAERYPMALVFITDPESRPAVPAEILGQLYGLTPAQARLAAALAGGISLKDFAAEAEISLNTARWTLKQVFAKTDTKRQAELVRLLLTGLAGLKTEAGD